ncbi:hypothetical protein EV424DRAFT_1418443 [Suillus variegatus]|nr:hypothetical protein EV424DRAFT_1418443 [Suillus variegatus]
MVEFLLPCPNNLRGSLDQLSALRFANRRLRLFCIPFPVTATRQRHSRDQETCLVSEVRARNFKTS